jgi:tetratricopeptide (TPR) repeat protein
VKIHHFDKREPGARAAPGRGAEVPAGTHPTVPELALRPPRKGGAAAEHAPVGARTELELPAQAAPAPAARGANKRSSRKLRSYEGPSPTPRPRRALEVEPAPGSVAERLATSRRLFGEGRLEEARSILERLVVLGVATGPVHTQLGAIYLAQGAIERALERFDAALSRDAEDLSATLFRGEARLARGDLLLARTDLQHVLELGMAGSPLVQRAQQLLQLAADRKRR